MEMEKRDYTDIIKKEGVRNKKTSKTTRKKKIRSTEKRKERRK